MGTTAARLKAPDMGHESVMAWTYCEAVGDRTESGRESS